jgi:hypothetical protein
MTVLHAPYSALSPKELSLPSAVRYANNSGCILQSVRESALWDCLGLLSTSERLANRLTRTAAIYFKDKGEWKVAVSDSSDLSNIILARPNEHQRRKWWEVPRSDSHIESMIEKAYQEDRIISVNDSFVKLSSWRNKNFKVLDAFVLEYSRALTKCYNSVSVSFHHESSLEKVHDKNVLVAGVLVSYGHIDAKGLSRFNKKGYARGMRYIPARAEIQPLYLGK